jgi:Sec-independent protein translocase protein TatA
MAFLNLGFSEIVLIAIVAILVFGKRLPEVASQAFRQVAKARRGLEDLRRESGIDRELRDVRSAFHDIARESSLPPSYPSGTAWRPEARLVEPETPVKPAVVAPVEPAAPAAPPEAPGPDAATRLP